MITEGSSLIQCRYCPQRAVWATFQTTGRRALINPHPTATGNLDLTREKGVLIAEVIPPAKRGDHDELYESHFATCPGAKAARRPRDKFGPIR